MTRYLYIAPIALIGLIATQASAAPVPLSDTLARDITAATAERTDTPLVLVRGGGRGGGGGGARGGGGYAGGGANRGGAANRGGGSWSGAGAGSRTGAVAGNSGNFNTANVNRGGGNTVNRGNVNVSGNNVNRNVNVNGGATMAEQVGVASPLVSR
jgi:hypothetical protein